MARLLISSRSKWKGSYSKFGAALLDRVKLLRNKKKRKNIFKYMRLTEIYRSLVNTDSRSSVIQQPHIVAAKRVLVSNGKSKIVINFTSDHLGHRLGEFVRTTQRGGIIHKNNAKTKKNKAKK